MNWIKLSALKHDTALYRGTLFRFRQPAFQVGEEEIAEYMLLDPANGSGCLGLVRDSGYNAGLILVVLPNESLVNGKGAVSSDWLYQNWGKWVQPESDPSNVWLLIENRPEPENLPDE